MDALVALVLALLLVFVFTVAWVGKVAALGGVAFFIYCVIVIVRWLLSFPWRKGQP
jgi:hypothetical protein